MQTVGGPGLEAQMHALAPDRVEQLVDVYRAHNEPLHDELEACAGMEDVLVRLHEEGRRLGVVTAKRRSTVELAFASVPLGHLFEAVVGGDETERHKPDPEPLLLGAERLGADPAATAYVGDSPFDVRAAKAAGMFAVAVTWGRIHDRRAARGGRARRDRRPRRGAPWRPLRPRPPPRAPQSCATSSTALSSRTTSRTQPIMEDAAYDVALRRARRARGGAPRARHARLADPARGRPVGQVREGAAPGADGLAREGDDRGGSAEVGRGRPQAPRHRRAGRLRARAEDRRPCREPDLRERRPRARRDPRRRRPGRGRHAEPAHDQGDPAAPRGRRAGR